MYDTIQFRLDISGLNKSEISYCLNKLNIVSQTTFNNGISTKGVHKGLGFIINDNNIKLREGSLCKYYLGNNQKTLSRGDTQRSLEQLSDELKLNFSNAICTRIDVAQNIVLKQEPLLYLNYLGSLQYFKKQPQQNGLYYLNSTKTHLFYGKIKEQLNKGVYVPEALKKLNILRYETRLTKRINQFFNVPKFQVSDLYNEEYYIQIMNFWKSEYFRINKVNKIMNDFKPTGSTKDFIDYLALMSLNSIGQEKLFLLIKEWQKTDLIDKKQAFDLRKKVKSLNEKELISQKSELIEELDKKINEITFMYR